MVVAAALGTAGVARAANSCVWDGTSNNFNSAAHWTSCGGTSPQPTDSATVGSGTVTVTAAVSIASLTISGGAVTVNGSNAISLTGSFLLSSGTFTDAGGNLTVGTTSGSLTVSGGVFTGGTGTITVNHAGTLTVSGGTFTSGTGTITSPGVVTVSNTDNSLIGYWALDDTASPATDSSGNGNSLPWVGSPSASTSVPSVDFTDPYSLALNGGTQSAAATGNLPTGMQVATVSLSAWYRATSVDTKGAEIVSGGNCYALRITTVDMIVVKRIATGAGTASWVEYHAPLSGHLDGNWHHLTGVIVPGTGGGMAAYFDGAAITAGTKYVQQTSGTTIGTDTNAINYGTLAPITIGQNPGDTTDYNFGTGCSGGTCAIDDVRVYSRALSASEVTALSNGDPPGSLILNGPLAANGGVNVQSAGTLTLAASTAAVTLGSGTTLKIDGTLNASAGTIQSASGTYTFVVGSTSAATPALNISGLTVKNTDLNGMQINTSGGTATGAVTTFTELDNVAFSNGTNTSTGVFLQIYATSLNLTSNGCTFDSGVATATTKLAVKLTGNGYNGTAPDTNETRAVFGGTACATNLTDGTTGMCSTSAKSDDDSDNDGIGGSPDGACGLGKNCAVVQFVRAAVTGLNGNIEGFPTAAFDWSTFVYYSTYVAYHDADATGTKDRVYVRNEDGSAAAAGYYWEAPAGETIVGTPRWYRATASSTAYVYVGLASGKIYRLVDDTSGHTLGTTGAGWTTNPVTLSGTTPGITTPIVMDTVDLYVGGTVSGGQRVWGLAQSSGSAVSGSPATVPKAITSDAPAEWINGATTYFMLGASGDFYQVNVTNWTAVNANTSPGTGNAVAGRLAVGTKNATWVFGGDAGGHMSAIDPSNFTNAAKWQLAGLSGTPGSAFYDRASDTLMFGTSTGRVYSVSAATATTAALMTGYTGTGYKPNSNTDSISAPPFYAAGILVVGTDNGKLYFIDRNTQTSSCSTAGAAPNLLREYNFGTGVSVSGVGFDAQVDRYMVSTSSSANNGSLYYFDLINDQTACN